AKKLGVDKNVVFDPTLARGLDYYTGPIFESTVEEPGVGSITGGGRYDDLLSDLGGPDLPATGTSFGLDRIVDAITDLNLWKDVEKTSSKVLVTIFSDKLLGRSIEVINLLRKSAISAELFPDESAKLNKQLKYADNKGIPWAIIIGPNEALKGEVVLKNMSTQKQETVPTETLLTRIR
ncbi:MAG: His/Gly/Thr/Pro-type tRNA ligase C-terminal domain-containing protein, partial [Patescibacteria group bacterium]